MIRLLTACCLLLGAVLAPAAEPIPADCRWVVSMDVQAVASSQIGGWLKGQLGKQQTAAQLQVLEAVTGFNPVRDLKRVTICAAADGDETGLVLVRGTFDADRLAIAAQAADNHATVAVAGRTVHTWSDHGRTAAGCLAGPDLLILGRSVERIRQAITAIDAGATPPIAFPAGWEASALTVAAADGLDQLAGTGPQSALLRNFRTIAGRLSESGGMVVLEAVATAPTEAQAQQVVDAGNGLRAIVQLQKPENLDPALIDCVRTAQLGHEGERISLRMSLPVADAKRLADQQQKKGGH